MPALFSLTSCLRLPGFLLAALLLAHPAVAAPVDVALAIDTAAPGPTIPGDFVGMSVSSSSISGNSGYVRIFSPRNPNYRQLTALFRQIGIKHLRTIMGPATPGQRDATSAECDDFFQFAIDAGVTGKAIIYSLHLGNADNGDPTTDNATAAKYVWSHHADQLQAFALDNETDFPGNRRKDPQLRDYAGYRAKWERIREATLKVAPGAPFSGLDTGSNFPVPGGQDTAVHEGETIVPWTLQFARDEAARITMASQHYYCVDNYTAWLPWTSGAYFGRHAIVADPQDPAHPSAYYISNRDGISTVHPSADSQRWTLTTAPGAVSQQGTVVNGKGIWVADTAYAVGDEVQDPQNAYRVYVCQIAGASARHPSLENGGGKRWREHRIRNAPGPAELIAAVLSPRQIAHFALLDAAALRGNRSANGWPSPANGFAATLPYRMTEASPMSGGQSPAAQMFATALMGLDMFHWFAQHGCGGMNPFMRVAQTNAPIHFDGKNDIAAPYAYAMLAFTLAGPGNHTLPVAPMTLPPGLNLTAYATGNPAGNDVYVTVINKTYAPVDAVDARVTLNLAGFSPTNVTSLVLTSGTPGDAAAKTATLGGATIPNDGTAFKGAWENEPISNATCVVLVPAATAKIIHLRRDRSSGSAL